MGRSNETKVNSGNAMKNVTKHSLLHLHYNAQNCSIHSFLPVRERANVHILVEMKEIIKSFSSEKVQTNKEKSNQRR